MSDVAGESVTASDLSAAPFEDLVAEMIRRLGDDPDREGMLKTPERVAKSMAFLTKGYGESPGEVVGEAIFEECHRNMVLVKDIEVYSLCEHHLLPFFGKAHVAYIPTDRIVGISKLARIVEVYARRLQNQERITTQVADALEKHLKPLGAAVIIEASHACMGCRGVKKSHAIMSTSAMRGVFFDKAEARAELMQLIKE